MCKPFNVAFDQLYDTYLVNKSKHNYELYKSSAFIYRSFAKVLYVCNFCKSIHIPLTMKERASKQFIVNNLVETYSLSMYIYIYIHVN